MLALYKYLLKTKPEENIKNVLLLVEIMLALSPSMYACERGFSATD